MEDSNIDSKETELVALKQQIAMMTAQLSSPSLPIGSISANRNDNDRKFTPKTPHEEYRVRQKRYRSVQNQQQASFDESKFPVAFKQCLLLTHRLMATRKAKGIFSGAINYTDPLKPLFAQNYTERVPHPPIDLSTIDRKLRERAYASLSAFKAELDHVWENAMSYNGPAHWIHHAALECREIANKEFTKIFKADENRKLPKEQKQKHAESKASRVEHDAGRKRKSIETTSGDDSNSESDEDSYHPLQYSSEGEEESRKGRIRTKREAEEEHQVSATAAAVLQQTAEEMKDRIERLEAKFAHSSQSKRKYVKKNLGPSPKNNILTEDASERPKKRAKLQNSTGPSEATVQSKLIARCGPPFKPHPPVFNASEARERLKNDIMALPINIITNCIYPTLTTDPKFSSCVTPSNDDEVEIDFQKISDSALRDLQAYVRSLYPRARRISHGPTANTRLQPPPLPRIPTQTTSLAHPSVLPIIKPSEERKEIQPPPAPNDSSDEDEDEDSSSCTSSSSDDNGQF